MGPFVSMGLEHQWMTGAGGGGQAMGSVARASPRGEGWLCSQMHRAALGKLLPPSEKWVTAPSHVLPSRFAVSSMTPAFEDNLSSHHRTAC